MKKILPLLIYTLLMGAGLRAQTVSTFPWSQTFNNSTTLDSTWTVSNGWPVNRRYSDCWDGISGGAYIITPALSIPTNNTDRLAFWVSATESFDLLVGPSSATTLADFTDTLYSWRRVGHHYRNEHAAVISAYAGSTIRVALVKCDDGQCLTLYSMGVDYDTLPAVELFKPSVAITGTPVQYSAVLAHGPDSGLSYTWHSTLMDTTAANTDSLFTIEYSVGGTDTVTVVASNIYGTDTASVTMSVLLCDDISTLPWTESFDNGILCWLPLDSSNWTTTSAIGLSAMGSLMVSRFYDDEVDSIDSWIATRSIHIPADADDSLILVWDTYTSNVPASFRHNYYVLATEGEYNQRSGYDTLFSAPQDQQWPMWSRYVSASVPLGQYAGSDIHIAFCHKPHMPVGNNLQHMLMIDNVRIYSLKPPVVRLNYHQAFVADTTVFTANLIQGSSSGRTFTWHSSLLDTTTSSPDGTFTLIYTAAGTDTLSVIVSNSYGTDTATAIITVSNCPPQSVPWSETFASANDLGCWIGDFSRGVSYVSLGNEKMCSPLINIPADAEGLRVYWRKKYSNTRSYSVLVSPTGGSDSADFTDTLYFGNASTLQSAHLDAYAASQIRVAFEKANISISIDEVRIDYDSTAPQAALTPSELLLRMPDTLHVTAALNDCSTRGLAYSWHSAMADAGLASIVDSTDTQCSIVYSATGIDTIAYIVSNQYGADTQRVAVTVNDCNPYTLPYSEDFNGVAASSYNVAGSLPICWDIVWNGLENTAPHVVGNGNYYRSPDGTPSLLIQAGTDNAAQRDDTAYVMLPFMGDTLNKMTIRFWYCYELSSYNTDYGTLTLGYMNGDDYVSVFNIQPSPNNNSSTTIGITRVIDLASLPDSASRLCFRWLYTGGDWYSVTLDNISIELTPAVDSALCSNMPIPYTENFDRYDVFADPQYPTCWEMQWNGNANKAPHVDFRGTNYGSPDSSNVLKVEAGTYTNYDSVACMVLPRFADTLDLLSISLWHTWEDTTHGTLTVGYIDNGVFVAVDTLAPAFYQTSSGQFGRSDTVDFSMAPLSATNMALRWTNSDLWWAVYLDDIHVFYTDCPECTHEPDTVWRTVSVLCDSTMGSVSGGGLYPDSSWAAITAAANDGYHFVSWNDGDTANPRQVFVVSDTALTAYFEAVGDSVGIDIVGGAYFSLYPNPASGMVNIESSEVGEIRIYDISGRERMSAMVDAGMSILDISGIVRGVYFVRMGPATVKLVVK